MPIIRSMMQDMQKKYGTEKGKNVYYAVENKMKGKGKLRSMLAKANAHKDLS
jgi:hypothetical protein